MTTAKILSAIAFAALLSSCHFPVEQPVKLPLLKVSDNHRYLMSENGAPFFWQGDTAWLLFGKLNREEAEVYLQDRADKGFNVVQVMVLHSLDVENGYGKKALVDGDITKPHVTDEYDFWDHADYIIDLSAAKGIYVALVPIWGSNVKNGRVRVEQAETYARWLANRYKDRSNVVWLNGGDLRGDDALEVWNAIGRTIDEVCPDQLITFHPRGRTTSSIWFQEAEWLDFNMFQSGHRRYDQDDTEWGFGEDNWKYVKHDLAQESLKPTLDGEPSYEGIPQGLHDTTQPYWIDSDARRYAYWSVFAGACGHTYGDSSIMQFYRAEDAEPAYGAREYWMDAKDAPGASQMQYLKQLMLAHSYFERVPDQSLIAGENGEKYERLIATRGEGYALIYTCTGRDIPVVMGKIAGATVKAGWFDPRTGIESSIGEFKNVGVQVFDPPGEPQNGNDWVLILDSVGSKSAIPVSAERIAALPEEVRPEWERYWAESQRLRAVDEQFIQNELGKKTEWKAAPKGRFHWRHSAEWYASAEARTAANNILSFQTPAGGWGKNLDYTSSPRATGMGFTESRAHYRGTFDNNATTRQLLLLGQVAIAQDYEPARDGFLRGLEYILKAQYPNGGWPQVYPLEGGYHDNITYNDGAMINVLEFLHAVEQGDYPFVDDETLMRVRTAIDRGDECILETQVVEGGVKKVWCAQHDPITLKPAKARSFEWASLSGGESAGIVVYLMEQAAPSTEMHEAVAAAHRWFVENAIYGKRFLFNELKLINDPEAGPIWPRFFELETGRPIFVQRDASQAFYSLVELPPSSNGYAWYQDAGKDVLEKYPAWNAEH